VPPDSAEIAPPPNPTQLALQEKFSPAIHETIEAHGELTFVVEPAKIVEISSYLKKEQGFERLSSVTAVDWWPREPRFEIVYHLHSIRKNIQVRLKIRIDGETPVESVTVVWRSANWYEREVFDLFGVTFRNHPNLERIMMPVDFEGHPLRKDFPIHGYKYSYRDE
jgi:NADH-quinone oxidoreductase subunit C